MEQKRKSNGHVFTWRFKLKISEYIKYLQELKNKHGDVDVKVNRIFECSDLSINDTFEEL